MKITAPQFFSLTMAALLTGAILTSCNNNNKRDDHLRGKYRENSAGFEKKWGTGPGTDRPRPGKDRW